MAYARRKDAAHSLITEQLEAEGLAVFDVSMVPGLGFDIVAYDPVERRWFPFEVKSEPRTRRRAEDDALTVSQLRALSRAPIPCVTSAAEALRFFRSGL